MRWFRRAAEQGDSEAQNNLGLAYYYGSGVPKDLLQAFMWFNRSATSAMVRAEDMEIATRERDTAANNREIVTRHMSQEQLDAALAWLRQEAEKGDADAMFNLGL